MAPRSRHSHASLMVVLSILLFAGIGVFVAQTVAQKRSLDALSKAAEKPLKPRFTPTPSPLPTKLPTGKPEILGEYTERTTSESSSQSPQYSISTSQSKTLNNSILFSLSGIVVVVVVGFLFSSKALLL